MKQIIITNRAVSDIKKAEKWYESRQKNLGIKFVDHIFICFNAICNNPLGYASKYRYTREMAARQFPYTIIYSLEEEFIFILRIFPDKSNPKKKYRIKK